jgi:hypothetical protein
MGNIVASHPCAVALYGAVLNAQIIITAAEECDATTDAMKNDGPLPNNTVTFFGHLLKI